MCPSSRDRPPDRQVTPVPLHAPPHDSCRRQSRPAMRHFVALMTALLLMPQGPCSADADAKAVRVFIFAGQSNMVGLDSKAGDIRRYPPFAGLDLPQENILFSYNIGREEKLTSEGWVPLQPVNEVVGPELSFARRVSREIDAPIAIAKFTHSGSQMNDWTPQGTAARDRNLYPQFIAFIRESIQGLRDKGHEVVLAGIFYRVGENDLSFGPHRRRAVDWLRSTVEASRRDLELPTLKWFVSQQRPPDGGGPDAMDVSANLAAIAAADPDLIHVRAFDLPPDGEKLVIPTAGIVQLGALLARSYLDTKQPIPRDRDVTVR